MTAFAIVVPLAGPRPEAITLFRFTDAPLLLPLELVLLIVPPEDELPLDLLLLDFEELPLELRLEPPPPDERLAAAVLFCFSCT